MTKQGKWAIVTGATDGIGKAIAFELAKKGMNVLLISRTEQKLVDTAEQIKAKYSRVEADYLVVDFSNFDDKAKAAVASHVKDMEVGVLVNNVGVSYSFPKFYHELSDEDADNLVEMNIFSTQTMTRIVLPGMLERSKGYIINISSAASASPCPLLAAYNASKSWINGLSESLDGEYAAKGVRVQSQIPLFVTTKLAKIRKSSLTVPTPESYARASVNAFGYESLVSPYWAHAAMVWALSLLPAFVVHKIMMGSHLGLRKRGMKKEAEKKGQ